MLRWQSCFCESNLVTWYINRRNGSHEPFPQEAHVQGMPGTQHLMGNQDFGNVLQPDSPSIHELQKILCPFSLDHISEQGSKSICPQLMSFSQGPLIPWQLKSSCKHATAPAEGRGLWAQAQPSCNMVIHPEPAQDVGTAHPTSSQSSSGWSVQTAV